MVCEVLNIHSPRAKEVVMYTSFLTQNPLEMHNITTLAEDSPDKKQPEATQKHG
jgi:hypothetical protein